MRMKKFLKAAEVAIGTGLFLLNQSERINPRMRNKLRDQLGDLRDRAGVAYEAAADRVAEVSKSLRKKSNHSAVGSLLKFAAGIGIGVGVGLLMAPANGVQTRQKLAEKAQEFGGTVRHRFAAQDLPATGTGD